MSGDIVADVQMTPRLIVLHWTAGSTASSAWNTFAPSRLGGRPDLDDAGAVNVSAHFLVDRDGSIQQLMATDRIGRHVIGLNHLSIGIENVGDGSEWPPHRGPGGRQRRHWCVTWSSCTPPSPTSSEHLEYRQMEGHAYFEELDPSYRTTKPDPGAPFMEAVRAQVADLGLEAAP